MALRYRFSDNYVKRADPRFVEWLIEYLRLFADDTVEFKKLAQEVADSSPNGRVDSIALQAGCIYINELHSYFAGRVLGESLTLPLAFAPTLKKRFLDQNIASDLSHFGFKSGDFCLNETVLKILLRFDAIDNVIYGINYIVEKYSESVVCINVSDRERNHFAGSGFIVGFEDLQSRPRKLLVTNKHVVDPERWSIEVVRTSSGETLDLGQIFISDDDDLAMYDFTSQGDLPAMYLDPRVNLFQEIVALGYPFLPQVKDNVLLALTGQICGEVETYLGDHFVVMTAPISPGSSGGPVLNDLGMVVGVSTQNLEGKYQEGEVVHSVAIPSQRLLNFIDNLNEARKLA